MTRSKKPTTINFLVLADSHRGGERGKLDCFGVFTNVFVWATPAHREYSAVVGFENLRKGPIRYSFWLRKRHQKSQKIADAQGEVTEDIDHLVAGHRITFVLHSTGPHELGVKVGRRTHWFPFHAIAMKWPHPLEGEALQHALDDPHTLKAARAQITCKKCESTYTFEVRLDPNAKLSKGAKPFPDKGRFKCPRCGAIHHLKDIEGQLRSRLGRPVSEPAQKE